MQFCWTLECRGPLETEGLLGFRGGRVDMSIATARGQLVAQLSVAPLLATERYCSARDGEVGAPARRGEPSSGLANAFLPLLPVCATWPLRCSPLFVHTCVKSPSGLQPSGPSSDTVKSHPVQCSYHRVHHCTS